MRARRRLGRCSRLAWLALLIAAPSCASVFTDYELVEAAEGGPCTEENQAADCPAGYGCYIDHCLPTCGGPTCGQYRACTSGFCTDPIGRSCTDDDPLCHGSCEDRDASGSITPKYCTVSCDPDGSSSFDVAACPEGYACFDYACRVL